ncbi:AAA family ATPase [Streptomyces pinistramenti]|uniref:AAA family ATPase n=1 Tax=Streptomyces pinistramenti TaxID=2884812 RepID=UPI001D0899EE|nr:MoxR family ATPase [Streptomyces pinistramenti]MCB5908407.1 MoxR family ATPase [Streptomyces pinistramenti]
MTAQSAAGGPDDRAAGPEDWWVFRGPSPLPAPPPWRRFPAATGGRETVDPYLLESHEISVVNAALHLHRPLLVTGRPGAGKSSLARAVADELGLGGVLRWSVNSRSTLQDALYRYDAVGRLRETSLWREREELRGVPRRPAQRRAAPAGDIGQYLRLGPLGSALAAGRPRVLLVDELDKADIDLPNDLLVVLEEGEFEIPELARLPEHQQDVQVLLSGSRERVRIHRGVVRCTHFPIVVMTSNGERDFPPAFLRRCVRLDLPEPSGHRLRKIVEHHLGAEALAQAEDLIEAFEQRTATQTLATDQLLAAVHLRISGADLSKDELLSAVLHRLDEPLSP